jgi:hypothetical protein
MELWEGSYKQLLEDGIKESSDNWTNNSAYASHKGDQKGIEGPERAKREVMIITDMVKGESSSCQSSEEGADEQRNDLLPESVHP